MREAWPQVVTRGLFFGLGLLLLYSGAEALVRGASRLARSYGVSALVVGLTVVAFGTSMPELVVSALASAGGLGEVAVGNLVGSNIANIALILGLAALVAPLSVRSTLVRREIPYLVLVSAAAVGLAADGRIGRLDGLLLLAGFLVYLWLVFRTAASSMRPGEAALSGPPERPAGSPWTDVALVALGLGTLVAGAHLLVESSVWFARRLGVSDLIVGLTIVAVGTSLPELATSAVASFRREADIAVGNLVGSNLFNLLAILGLSATLRPLGAPRSMLRLEWPAMVAAALLLLPLAWTRLEVRRWEGVLLLTGYAMFLWMLVGRAAGSS